MATDKILYFCTLVSWWQFLRFFSAGCAFRITRGSIYFEQRKQFARRIMVLLIILSTAILAIFVGPLEPS